MQRGTNGNPVRELLCDVGPRKINKHGVWTVIGSLLSNSDGSFGLVFRETKAPISDSVWVLDDNECRQWPVTGQQHIRKPNAQSPLALASLGASRALGPLTHDSSTLSPYSSTSSRA